MTPELKRQAEELAEAYATGPGLKVTKVDKDNGVVTFTSEQVFDSACAAHFLAGFTACHERMSAERDAYAKAMAIALREGIFANKESVKRQISEALSRGRGEG